MSKIEIPKQLWFVKQGDENLAYVSYYENNAACRKKQITGRTWAGGRIQYEIDPVTRNYRLDANGKIIPIPKPPLDEKIVDNTLCTGWKISDKAVRWSTSNVVWRITSPHGFEFEIYSGNMMEIVKCATIVKGEIMDKCVLAKGNVLLPETSEPYKEAKKFTDLITAKSGKPSELKIGDIATFVDGNEYKFLGKFYSLVYECTPTNLDKVVSFSFEDKPMFFFKSIIGERISRIKSPKLLKITPGELDITDYSIEINKSNYINGSGDVTRIIAVSKTKVIDYSLGLEPIDLSPLDQVGRVYDPETMVFNHNIYCSNVNRGYYNIGVAEKKFNCYPFEIIGQTIKFLDCIRPVATRYGTAYNTSNYIELVRADIDSAFNLMITINGQSIKLKSVIY